MAATTHRSDVLDALTSACTALDWATARTLVYKARRLGGSPHWLAGVDSLRLAIGDTQHHGAPAEAVYRVLSELRLHV